jgi:thymidine kinase
MFNLKMIDRWLKNGKLIFRYGTMASGKSLQLLSTAYNYQEHSLPFLIFKSSIDTRDGSDTIHSRALGDRECVSVSPEDDLYKIMLNYKTLSEDLPLQILVDEAQFLTPSQIEQLAAIADNMGIDVTCYGLRTDFQTHLFPGSQRLFEIADELQEVDSKCYCGNSTMFNARVNESKEVITDGNQVEVGGDDRYIALCRKCYFEKTNHPLYKDNKKI